MTIGHRVGGSDDGSPPFSPFPFSFMFFCGEAVTLIFQLMMLVSLDVPSILPRRLSLKTI